MRSILLIPILTMTIVFKPQLRTGEVDKSRNPGRLISKFPHHICAIIKQLSYLFNRTSLNANHIPLGNHQKYPFCTCKCWSFWPANSTKRTNWSLVIFPLVAWSYHSSIANVHISFIAEVIGWVSGIAGSECPRV